MPVRSAIFRNLLFSAFLLITATLVAIDFYLTSYVARQGRARAQRELTVQTRILAGELANISAAGVGRWAHDADARCGARVTVIAPGGEVLADSRGDVRKMDNHAGRPEVRAAREGRPGFAVRRSATLDTELDYLAIPIAFEGRPGYVLRLAVPARELRDEIAAIRYRILGASALAGLASLVLAYFFTRSFTGRIRRVQKFAEQLPAARGVPPPPEAGNDELGALAASLARMARDQQDLVDRLSVESGRREAILSSMVEGVLAVDDQLRVTFCNESFARAVGAHRPVPERLPVLDVVRDPAFLDMLSRVLAGGESLKQRMQLAAAEGRSFEVQCAPLASGSRPGAIAILHDITDLERLERIRTDFVANVSHELRTPLTAIRGYAETLLDGAIDDELNNRNFLEKIRANAIRLNNIASDLLVLSELESGETAAPPEPVPVRAAVEAAVRTVESEAHVRGIRLKCAAAEGGWVMGHRLRLEQALVNLLDNAVKFNRPGGEVNLEVTRDDSHVRIAVSDTGIGIPSEDLPRIFERFYRVDKARSRQVGGTGLGLSIVKHTIERMNGTIAVESQLGKGSRFTLTLPAV